VVWAPDFAGACPVMAGALGAAPVPAAALPPGLTHAMAACHTLTALDGRLVGNEVEVRPCRGRAEGALSYPQGGWVVGELGIA